VTSSRRAGGVVLTDFDDIVAALRAAGHNVGATRRDILRVVLAREGAFTADELASSLEDVHVSTVYRSLALLEEIGVVDHVHLAHGPALYERSAAAGTAQHLVCELCGRHVSVPSTVFEQARRVLEADYGFVLSGGHFALTGRCANCR
jgi:Fur family transcriptional regulator, ferric uptake regulator